jgi:hypothetical protein
MRLMRKKYKSILISTTKEKRDDEKLVTKNEKYRKKENK